MENPILVLKQHYKDKIKTEEHLKAQLAAQNKVSGWTIDRWRYDNNPMLTTATNLSIIKNFLDLPPDAELTEEWQPENTPATALSS